MMLFIMVCSLWLVCSRVLVCLVMCCFSVLLSLCSFFLVWWCFFILVSSVVLVCWILCVLWCSLVNIVILECRMVVLIGLCR